MLLLLTAALIAWADLSVVSALVTVGAIQLVGFALAAGVKLGLASKKN